MPRKKKEAEPTVDHMLDRKYILSKERVYRVPKTIYPSLEGYIVFISQSVFSNTHTDLEPATGTALYCWSHYTVL
jgi:hypothetical protein